jgi:GNAT superfamily N-acetyltransferase
MINIRLREALSRDLMLVSSLEAEFPSRQSEPWSNDQFDLMIEKGPAVGIAQLVAEMGDIAVGYGITAPRSIATIGFDSASDSRMLTNVAVQVAHRGHGAGAKLVEGLTEQAQGAGVSLMFAHVPLALKPFYERLGWVVTVPDTGIAWIEPPSLRIWDMIKNQGEDPGPRRKLAMLRFDYPEFDPKYNCVAYRVLAPQKIELLYQFPGVAKANGLEADLAYGYLAFMCVEDAAIYAGLPSDVSQLVRQFIVQTHGKKEADRVARVRR